MLSQSAGFRFDRTLWRRFITVFQLYLYPKSPRSARHLFWLLFSGFLGVLLISMLLFAFIIVSCATFSLSFYNHYIKSVLRGFFVFDFNPTLNKLIVVSSILFVIGLYFYSQKNALEGRWKRWNQEQPCSFPIVRGSRCKRSWIVVQTTPASRMRRWGCSSYRLEELV